MKVKIYGAGSIGNNLAHASRQMGWIVDIVDVDSNALDRTRNEIYPLRYGEWDKEIRLFETNNLPKCNYDLIFVGTPPDTHIQLALDALNQSPKAILIEKPLCSPDLEGIVKLEGLVAEKKIPVFVGYDHVVGKAAEKLVNLLKEKLIGEILTIDFEFREHWGGIFSAHHWLNGPQDSYLGNIKKGGGASGEHSHALNLWQFFADIVGAGKVLEVQAKLDIVSKKDVKTETGLVGRVVQDVITKPARKWGRIQGEQGFYEWECGFENCKDRVTKEIYGQEKEIFVFNKTRPDDFIRELKHIDLMIRSNNFNSPICLENGLDTMKVLIAAHKSNIDNKTTKVKYN